MGSEGAGNTQMATVQDAFAIHSSNVQTRPHCPTTFARSPNGANAYQPRATPWKQAKYLNLLDPPTRRTHCNQNLKWLEFKCFCSQPIPCSPQAAAPHPVPMRAPLAGQE